MVGDETMKKPLNYTQIHHNEPIYFIQQYWNRELTEHEKNLVALTHDYVRTNMEAEEIKIVDVEK
jgi:hypothetical protein